MNCHSCFLRNRRCGLRDDFCVPTNSKSPFPGDHARVLFERFNKTILLPHGFACEIHLERGETTILLPICAQVSGSATFPYLCLPTFCSCPAFTNAVLLGSESLYVSKRFPLYIYTFLAPSANYQPRYKHDWSGKGEG